jgi:predicted PurR-regulated permease PerM
VLISLTHKGTIMNTKDGSNDFVKIAIESAIKIAILGVLVLATFRIIEPFVMPVLWGMIIAVAVEPFVGKIAQRLGGRGVDALMLVILIGALSGMMTAGIIGLFVGAVIVAIMYTLFMAWIEEELSSSPSVASETEA